MKFLTLAEARRIPESSIQYREDIWFGLMAQTFDRKYGFSLMDQYLKETGGGIDSYFMPIEYQDRALKGEDTFALSLAYGWYYGGVNVYISSERLLEVLETDPLPEIPLSWLDYLPGWTTHFPFINPEERSGFFLAKRKDDKGTFLLLGQPEDDGVTSIYNFRVREVEGKCFTLWSEEGVQVDSVLFKFFQSLLFFCTLIPHAVAAPKVSKQTRKGGVIDYHIHPLAGPREVPLDAVINEYVDGYQTEGTHSQSTRKAHFRRAHWRNVWLGPRDGEQHKELRWIPPVFVRGFKGE